MGNTYRKRWMGRMGWMAGILGVAVVISTAQANAASPPVTIRTKPSHLVAPATEVFIIRVPKHSSELSSHALVGYLHKPGAPYRMNLKKAAPGTWAGSVYASAPGTLMVRVYAKDGQLLRAEPFPVGKAKESWAPRIIIGAIFIGLALWYWRRMQGVSGGRFGPHPPR